MIAVIDNYDSFTYNLVQYLGELDCELKVFRNDEVTPAEISSLSPEAIVISPGPGRPDDAGVSKEIIRELGSRLPILGICLGHQCIGEAYGGKVVAAREILHGKTSIIRHKGHPLFRNVSNPFKAARYHSLAVDGASLPKELEELAKTDDGTVMAVAHVSHPVYGFQFHPESAFTNVGKHILSNFLDLLQGLNGRRP